MPALPSWDLIITLGVLVSVAYGYMIQRERVVVTLLSIYVGFVISQLLAGPISQFFAGDATIGGAFFIRSSASPFSIHAALFLGCVVIISLKSGLSGNRESGQLSTLEIVAYAALNAALIASVLISYLDPASQATLLASSKNAAFIFTHQAWWFIVPIVVMIITGHQSRRDY